MAREKAAWSARGGAAKEEARGVREERDGLERELGSARREARERMGN